MESWSRILKSHLFVIIILFCLGLVIYSHTLSSSFHFDDHLSIVSNLKIRNIFNLKAIFNFWPTRFITYLSLALNYRLEHLNVFGYHLFNLLVHLASAALVWQLTLLTLSTQALKDDRVSRKPLLIAFFTALIFLTHPIQTQGVTYIIQRATSLATLFYLASLTLYAKARLTEGKKQTQPYYLASLTTAILAMFTKEMTITLPLMILLYEFCFLKGEKKLNLKYLIPLLATFFIIPLTMLLTKSVNISKMHLNSELAPSISPIHYFLTQLRVMVTYLRLLILPINQNLDYDYPVFRSLLELPVLLSTILIGILIFTAIKVFQKHRIISFAIFWFFLTLLPESSFIPIRDLVYEHRLYLPMFGFSLFLVYTIYYLTDTRNLRLAVALLSAIVIAYSVLTYSRNFVWKDEISL